MEAHVHRERKPRLHADMAQARFLVQEVVVEVKTFARFEHQMNVFGLPVPAHGVGQAVLQGAENGDQARGDTILAGDLAGQVFLAGLAAGQITEGAPGLLGGGIGGGLDAGEIGFHHGGLEEMAQGAAQRQTVKTRQNACHRAAESVKKGRRNAGDDRRSLLFHHPNFYPNARRSATLVAALPRYAFALNPNCIVA